MRNNAYLLNCCAIVQMIAPAGTASAQTPANQSSEPQSVTEAVVDSSDIIVTANRRSESISKVPISITAITPAALESAGIKNMGDLSRQVSGVTFTQGINGSTNLSVRGISSLVGAATTGIYIDDTPIQSRFVGASQSSTNPYPLPFDVSRVEVLRGPQGTLFGAGSQGGAIRFISPTPSLTEFDFNGRAELASTENGAPSYEVGVAGGGPIVQDKLGVHLAGYYRRDGGWVDRVSYPTLAVTENNANRQDNYLLRASAKWQATEDLTISPSVTYQRIHRDDDPGYSRRHSSPSGGRFNNVQPLHAPWTDRYLMAALNADYDLGQVHLINVTSFFRRTQRTEADYSSVVGELLGQNFDTTVNLGIRAPATLTNKQKAFTQEIRLQSANNPGDRLKWIIGGFYQDSRQSADQAVHFNSLTQSGDAALDQLSQLVFGAPALAVFGSGLIQPGNINYFGLDSTRDRQMAVFGQVDFEVAPSFVLTGGVRAARFKFDYTNAQGGPYNGGPSGSSGSASVTKVTPKFGVQYTPSANMMVYASVSRGVRQGGANTPVPASRCAADLAALGIGGAPDEYKPDSVWSYEAGAKGKIFDGVVDFDGSAFNVRWKGIQSVVFLNNCGFNFITNLGGAVSRGFDLRTGINAAEGLRFDLTVGYTDAHYTETSLGAPNAAGTRGVIVAKGDKLPIAPWRATVAVDYKLPIEMGDYRPYLHGNYSYSQAYFDGTGPGTITYDPLKGRRDAINLLSGRMGISGKGIDASVFVDNILNDHPVLGVARVTSVTELIRDYTLRPRTFGLSLSYKY